MPGGGTGGQKCLTSITFEQQKFYNFWEGELLEVWFYTYWAHIGQNILKHHIWIWPVTSRCFSNGVKIGFSKSIFSVNVNSWILSKTWITLDLSFYTPRNNLFDSNKIRNFEQSWFSGKSIIIVKKVLTSAKFGQWTDPLDIF